MEESLVNADWQKISVLGSGAFGVVTLWKNNETQEFVAIKKCKFHTPTSLTLRQKERWFNEVQIMKTMKHPNVISYKPLPVDFEEELLKYNPSKLPLLPMEYCTKGNLRHVLRDPKNLSGLSEFDVRSILEDIANGLEYLHSKNITHRDLKPDNIVIQHCDQRPMKTLYKIIDLGYAKELNDTVVSFVGTLNYLAPEIFKNEKYNCTVDYWSMGILAFEIICGTLPFLPNLTPFERYEKLREKGPDDICIYMAYSGSIAYSTEIKKEHHISNWLKEKMEVWLRHVLQFDPNNRTEIITNSTNVFQYLRDILSKTVVNVCSIPKLEFYSYEINESTLVDTLKDWVSRDIKVPKNEVTLIFQTQDNCFTDGNSLVLDFIKNNEDVFAIRKNSLICDLVTYNFPKLLKELFNLKFNFSVQFIPQLFAQTLFYISEENKVLKKFKRCFDSYFNYVQKMCDRATETCAIMKKTFAKLLTKVECYNSMRKDNVCDINLRTNKEYRDCVNYSQRLVSSLERCLEYKENLVRKIKILTQRKVVLRKLMEEMNKIFGEFDIQPQFDKTLALLEMKDPKDRANLLPNIRVIVSDTIKVKNKLFSNKKLKAYLEASCRVLNPATSLVSWIKDFEKHLCELSEAFEQNEINCRNSLIKAASHKSEGKPKQKQSNGIIAKELLELPVKYLVQENQELRFRIEEVLSSGILEHKKGAECVSLLCF